MATIASICHLPVSGDRRCNTAEPERRPARRSREGGDEEGTRVSFCASASLYKSKLNVRELNSFWITCCNSSQLCEFTRKCDGVSF